jgi:hypothetical protein
MNHEATSVEGRERRDSLTPQRAIDSYVNKYNKKVTECKLILGVTFGQVTHPRLVEPPITPQPPLSRGGFGLSFVEELWGMTPIDAARSCVTIPY